MSSGPDLSLLAESSLPALASAWEPRVLVVDDDDVARFAAEQLLESLGFTVDVVSGGQEAIRLSAGWPYAAILMDCGMPEVDGYCAARGMRRRDGASRHTLVIATTSHPRSVSIASGMDAHLGKPLTIDLLHAELTKLGLLARDGVRPTEPAKRLGADTPLLELSILEEIGQGDRTSAAARVHEFIWQATVRLPEMWRAANEGDLAALRRLADDLEPSAALVGAARVAYIFHSLGEAASRGATTLAAGIEPSLRQALHDTAAVMTAYADAEAPSDASATRAAGPDGPVRMIDADKHGPEAPIRVTVADDDRLALFAVQAMIERADGLELVGSANGVEEIVDLAAIKRPEVVVLDWMMPGGGGPEAARRILYQSPDTRIIALTASNTPEATMEMMSAGASRVLTKGHSVNMLEHTIHQISRPLREHAGPTTAPTADEAGAHPGRRRFESG